MDCDAKGHRWCRCHFSSPYFGPLFFIICSWCCVFRPVPCGDCNTLDCLFMKFGSIWQCSFFVCSAVMAITAYDNYLFLHQGIFLRAEVKAFIKSASNIIVLHWQYKVEKQNVYLPKNIGNYFILDNPAVLLFNGNFCLGAPRGQCAVWMLSTETSTYPTQNLKQVNLCFSTRAAAAFIICMTRVLWQLLNHRHHLWPIKCSLR